MRINFLLGSLMFRKNRTGVHLYYYNLLKRFVSDCDKCVISAYDSKNDINEYVDECFWGKVKFSHKIVRILMYLIPAECFWGKSDIYVCDGISPVTLFKSKRIFVIHDLMVYMYPENYGWLKKIYLKYFFSKISKADKIIAVSQQTKSDIVNLLNVDENKISVVYNGVDKILLEDEKINLKVDTQRKFLFYIGDFRKNKNVLTAIKAYREYLNSTDDDMLFYLAGNAKGDEYKELLRYVQEYGLEDKVIFLGYVTDAEKVYLYKHAYAFIFVSLYEGFGVPIIESMLYETPVITSNCSSMAEIATGESAILVDPLNVRDIADAIDSLNNQEVRKSYIASGKNIAMKYTWDNAYNDFKRIIYEFGEK